MRNLVTLASVAILLVFFAGCAKKPKVEAPTKPTTEETKPTTPAGEKPTGETPVTAEPSSRFMTIYFDFDKYNLRDEAKAALRKNAEVMKSDPNLKILIEGHCDERGTVEYNLALGERRAKAARDYMISLGIEPSRISIISYGKERPVAFGHDEESWQKNRRDEFIEK